MSKATTDYKRPDWDEYFLQIAEVVGLRGSCDRGRCGAVITKDNRIVMTGYVGAPPGQPHCDEVGHDMQERKHSDGTSSSHCVRTAHSEENAIIHAAKFGVTLQGTKIYTKIFPCINCARMIVTAGIVEVMAQNAYQTSTKSKELFDSVGIKYTTINDETKY